MKTISELIDASSVGEGLRKLVDRGFMCQGRTHHQPYAEAETAVNPRCMSCRRRLTHTDSGLWQAESDTTRLRRLADREERMRRG